MATDDSPTASGATNVLLNQRSLTAPYHRAAVGIQGDENPGKAIGFDANGVLTAIMASDGTTINVIAAGAENDDTGDQGLVVQSVIDSAPLGSTILFPPGNYKVLTGVNTLAKRLHFKGAGAHCTRINFRPSAPSALFTIPANSDNVYFSDISLVGSGNPGTNIRMGAIKQLSDAPTNSALTECFITRVNFEQFTDDVLFFNALEYSRISECRFLNNTDIDAYGGSGLGTPTCIRSNTHANAIHVYKCRFGQNDRAILAPAVTLFDISNNTFELHGSHARGSWVPDYFVDIGTGSGESRGLTFRNNYVEGNSTAAGKAFMRIRDSLAPMITGNTFSGSYGSTTYSHTFIEFSTGTLCARVACNWFAEILTSFMSVVSGGGKVRAWDNMFVDGGAFLTTKAAITALLNPSSNAFELDGDFINRSITVDVAASGEDGFNVRGTGHVSSKIQTLSTSGARSAYLDLEVANTGANDPAGSVHFKSGYGIVAQVDGQTNNIGNGGILKLRTADTSMVMTDRLTFDSVGYGIFGTGLRPGTMTKTQRNALSSPPDGLVIYQTDNTPGLRVRENGAWVKYTATADA